MKFFPTLLSWLLQSRTQRRNFMVLIRLLVVLLSLITLYSILFHVLMAAEGQDFTWLTGFYWTLTVMSTLGFGDITFETDLGRIFSIIVLITGMTFMLVLLPFTFIEFFYAPWMEAQKALATPRSLPETTKGHVVLTHHDAVSGNLIKKLEAFGQDYALVVATLDEAHRLSEMGLRVVLGDLDDPDTYRRVGLDRAILLAATGSDTSNTNAVFTARDVAPAVRIVTTVAREASLEVLRLAGANHVLQLPEMLGQSLARRCSSGKQVANLLGRFDQVAIAEAPMSGTPLVGSTLAESRLRAETGVNVVGLWERGSLAVPRADTRLEANSVLVLAGSDAQIAAFNHRFSKAEADTAPVVIVGGGRVGRATGRALAARGVDFRIVERLPERVRDPKKYTIGDAFERDVLQQAGIESAPAAILTTHDDDTNIYLAIYIRRLRPDIQLIGRANLERNISTLHRAGTDFVMSYAGMGAGAVLNILRSGRQLMVAEGLDVLKVPVPAALAGKTIGESGIRNDTGCSVVGVGRDGAIAINPPPDTELPENGEIVLIGTVEAEGLYLEKFPQAVAPAKA